MLENLKDLVRQYAGDTIIDNPAIPNERNEEAVVDASHSIFDGLKGALANGNADSITDLFKGGADAAGTSPVTQNIKTGFMQDLVRKFGLDHGKASQIAGGLIPVVLSKFINKTNDPNDKSFDLQSILSNLTGGGGFNDILGKLGGNNSEGNKNKNDDGLAGNIKGMFN